MQIRPIKQRITVERSKPKIELEFRVQFPTTWEEAETLYGSEAAWFIFLKGIEAQYRREVARRIRANDEPGVVIAAMEQGAFIPPRELPGAKRRAREAEKAEKRAKQAMKQFIETPGALDMMLEKMKPEHLAIMKRRVDVRVDEVSQEGAVAV